MIDNAPAWKDVSSYSRGDKVRTPHCFQIRFGQHCLVVTRHIYHPGKWVTSCGDFFDEMELGAETAEGAKAEAIEVLKSDAEDLVEALTRFADAPPEPQP